MIKWKIEFVLKSGVRIYGLHVGPQTNSDEIANIYLAGNPEEFVGLHELGSENVTNMLVKRGEIAAAYISVYKEKE